MAAFESEGEEQEGDIVPAAGAAVADRADARALVQKRRWPWGGALALAPVVVFLGAALDERWWGWLGIHHMRPYFADLIAVLAAGEAHRAGVDAYAPNPFDPFGRPYDYGPLWLAIGHTGLDTAAAWWIGLILAAVFVVAAAVVLAPRNGRASLIGAALLASPPLLLGLERGNNDMMMFLLLAAGAGLMARSRRLQMAAGVGVLAVASALKLYPAATLTAALVRWRRGRLVLLLLGVGLLGAGAANWAWIEEYRRALDIVPRPLTIFAYGAVVVVNVWHHFPEQQPWLWLGVAIGLLAAAVPLARRAPKLWASVPVDGTVGMYFVVGALAWCFCFAALPNYPYRLLLLVLPARRWLDQLDDGEFGRIARGQLALWITVGWLHAAKRWLAVASLETDVPAAPKFLLTVIGFEQALVWVGTIALATAVVGWIVRGEARQRECAGDPAT